MSGDAWSRSLDSWLSPEPGKGPPQDDAWRRQSGFLRDFDLSNTRKMESAAEPSPVQQRPATRRADGLDTHAYAEERQRFRDMIRAFFERLMYAFPEIQNLDADQITLAAGWITDMEALTLEARARAEGYLRHGYSEFLAETDSTLKGACAAKGGVCGPTRSNRARTTSPDSGDQPQGRGSRSPAAGRAAQDLARDSGAYRRPTPRYRPASP